MLPPGYDDEGSIHDPTNRVQTAFHEAGHAVAYFAYGIPFRYITMRPRDVDTVAAVMPRPQPHARVTPVSTAIACLAGALADQYLHWLMEDAAKSLIDLELDIAAVAKRFGATLGEKWIDEVGDPAGVLSVVCLLTPTLYSKHYEVQEVAATWTDPSAFLLQALEVISGQWAAVAALADALLNRSKALPYAEAGQVIDPTWDWEGQHQCGVKFFLRTRVPTIGANTASTYTRATGAFEQEQT